MMVLDEKLLAEARKIRDRLIDLQYESDRTALAYQHAIRKLSALGGSLREIADALGLSHQRVHQIVDAGAGKAALKEQNPRRRRKGRRDRQAPLRCSFCDRLQAEVRKLIAGPGVYICDDCVDLAQATVGSGSVQASDLAEIHPVVGARKRLCTFCGKSPKQVRLVSTHPGEEGPMDTTHANICNECLDLCREILVEEGNR